MYPANEKHTSFRTPLGVYCYKVMPFGLKNAGATYQRAMDKIFRPYIRKTVECYVDDIVVKSRRQTEHLSQVNKMISLAAAFDDDVVHITLDRLAYVGPKDFIHCPLVGRSSILQTKRHNRIATDSQRCPERGLLFIGMEHLNLIVPRESIHKGHALQPACVINHDIRNWWGNSSL